MASVFPTAHAFGYDDMFWTGVMETVDQNIAVLGPASNGTLQIVAQRHIGDFQKRSFMGFEDLISPRDTTDVTAATIIAPSALEHISVKVNRMVGPIDMTMDFWKKVSNPNDTEAAEMILMMGNEAGNQITQDYVNAIILSLATAIQEVAALVATPVAGPITVDTLNSVNSLLGDRSNSVIAYVMHSKPWHDLVKDAVGSGSGAAYTGPGGLTISQGTVATLGRPVVVTDSPGLVVGSTPTETYVTMGLVANAGVVKESEERTLITQPQTGLGNLVQRMQGEYAFTLQAKGLSYTGARDPDDTALGTGSNWDKIATSIKDCAGAVVVTQ